MTTAAIDVVIPIYNAATTLDESLASIAGQTFADFRVIAVDDGSVDGTDRILASWAAKDSRFTVITKANGGIVDALNAGVAAVTAPLVARMDGDDLSLPGRFAAQHAYLAANPGCVAVGCAVDHIDQDGRPVPGLPQPGQPEAADATSLPAREPYIVHPFLMARTDALRSAGGYRHVPYSEDSDLFWRLAEGGRLHNLPETLGRYRMHVGSISGSSIVNGRIMAVGSQLGAASARRRRAGKADLAFADSLMAQLRRAGDMDAMSAVAATILDADEMAFFRLAVAIKLLELAGYRPYEIEHSDCAFVRGAVPHARAFATARNRAEIDWYLTETGKRLLAAGRLRDVRRLVPERLWPRLLLKACLRR